MPKWYHSGMVNLLKQFGPRVGLLLALAVALGGLFFLFELFLRLISSGPSDILAVNDGVGDTSQIPSGVDLIAFLAPAMCIALSGGAFLLMWRWLRSGEQTKLRVILLGGAPALALLGLGVYLAVSGNPIAGIPYEHHQVNAAGVKPLGLALLAVFALSVLFVGITRPWLLPIPLVLWLLAALFFGMFQSNAIYGLNLFGHPSRLQPTAAYASAVEGYRMEEAKNTPLVRPDIERVAERAYTYVVEGYWPTESAITPPPETGTLRPLVNAPWYADESVREEAIETLSNLEAIVTPLETGGFLVSSEDVNFWVPGMTAFQSPKPDAIEVFQVTGAAHIGYLRTGVGDTYTNGRWSADDYPISYQAGSQPRDLVLKEMLGVSNPDTNLSELNFDLAYWGALLAWTPGEAGGPILRDTLTVSSAQPGSNIPAGVLPVSLGVQKTNFDGSYLPWSATFESDSELAAYQWTSGVPQFSEGDLVSADPMAGSQYLRLPTGIPVRITQLAREITGNEESPYLKAKAIERYLRANYTYAFAPENGASPPRGQDPVDWFLFDHKEGTCGQFSSAFVVLARSTGIPARVVTGWAIGEVGVTQTVYSDQAHQWAEVPFEGLGWITFEPTAQGAAPNHAPHLGVWEDEYDRLVDVLLDDPTEEARAEAAGRLPEVAGELGLPPEELSHPLLEALLRDESSVVRAAAADALGGLNGPEVLESLVDALSNEDVNVRDAAAAALGDLDDREAVPPLTDSLSDEHSRVRETAADSLSKLGADVELLENGTYLVSPDGGPRHFAGGGATASQALESERFPVFQVSGAQHTGYLRNGVGDVYEDGHWVQIDALELAYEDSQSIGKLGVFRERLSGVTQGQSVPPRWLPEQVRPTELYEDEIVISPIDEGGSGAVIPNGVIPTSLQLNKVAHPGIYRPFSSTFVTHDSVPRFTWTSQAPVFSETQLSQAKPSDGSGYLQLPDDIPPRVRELALEITSGYDSPYLAARAIERHLKTDYTYAFAERGGAGPPPGQDPVDWFLFDSREGTCGQFSSAFVVLARSVGIPARVVTGLAIDAVGATQTVYSNQAHQWAEVPLEDLGWVTFEPTASGGAPSRTPIPSEAADSDGSQALGSALEALTDDDPEVRIAAVEALAQLRDPAAIEPLVQALSDPDAAVSEAARTALPEQGASVTDLESGGALVTREDSSWWVPGSTTSQAGEPPHEPVFEVRGASRTGYLRTATGDAYENGRWRQIDPVSIELNTSDLPDQVSAQIESWSMPEHRLNPSLLVLRGANEEGLNKITVSPIGSSKYIPAGVVPVALRVFSASHPESNYWPFSATVSTKEPVDGYKWYSWATEFSGERLTQSRLASDPTYTRLPEDMPSRIRQLALEITAGHESPYEKAKAIERFLASEYSYTFAQSGGARAPASRDPVDWFLFDQREGTCGQFSSAFVVLARSVGIPARVVSGWAIDRVEEAQIVYSSQAHQWAEVAFDGLGWVTFEPTASGGAPSRASSPEARQQQGANTTQDGKQPPKSSAGDQPDGPTTKSLLDALDSQRPRTAALARELLGGLAEGDSAALDLAAQLLSSDVPGVGTSTEQALESLGASVISLENGSSMISWEGQSSWTPGTTTAQAPEPDPIPVFQVAGATNTGYLRTSTGDTYSEGRWTQVDPLELPYLGMSAARQLVDEHISAASSTLIATGVHPETALFPWPQDHPERGYHQSDITLSAHPLAGNIPSGVLPVSFHLDRAEPNGTYMPFSATFKGNGPLSKFTWRSRSPLFSEDQLARARVIEDPAYAQLPDNLPSRIRDLAEEITQGLPGPYAKAKALEKYLSTQYTYAFAGPGDHPAPPGRDPVDWFLFETKKGTCGQFSSAFVVMARSLGIPARVVSGWAIGQTGDTQTVFGNQAHQWAEVGFAGLGWVTFEPTASGGAPSRTPTPSPDPTSTTGPAPEKQSAIASEPAPIQPPSKVATVTDIKQWPERTRRGVPINIGGTVTSQTGFPVDGMEVDVFLNVKKENGGIKVGSGTVTRGIFEIELRVPRRFAARNYQLIAHTIANETHAESWSDPEIGVYATTGLEFTGPAQIPVDVPAEFTGRLTDDNGDAVSNHELEVLIDGLSLPPVSTNGDGVFGFSNAFEAAGDRVVEVKFEEKGFILSNAASLAVSVTMPTGLLVDIPGAISVAKEFRVTGSLEDIRGNPLADQEITLSLNDAANEPIRTNAQGEFQLNLSVDRPGIHTVDAGFDGAGSLEPSARVLTFGVTEPVFLQIKGEGAARVGEEFVINGSLNDSRGNPLAQKTVAVYVDGVPEITTQTGAAGEFRLDRAFDRRGSYAIDVEFPAEGFLQPTMSNILVKVTEPVSLQLNAVREVQPGQDLAIGGALRDSRGNPLAQQTVTGFWNGTGINPVRTDAQGAFQLNIAAVQPGIHTLETVFQGVDLLEPASTQLSFKVTEPVFMQVTGDHIARVGAPYQINGVLTGPSGRPLSGFTLTAAVGGKPPSELTTDEQGAFAWETTFESEGRTNLKFAFAGTDELDPIQFPWPVNVGVPEIVVEPLTDVARGGTIAVRGIVIASGQTAQDIGITLNGEAAARSSAAGTFLIRFPVPADASLGKLDLEIAAPEFETQSTVSTTVKSATSIIVTPLERVRLGQQLPLEAKLLDDRGLGIPSAEVYFGVSVPAVTGPDGVASLTLQTPVEDGLTAIPLTFRFDGDDSNLPIRYFVGLPVTSAPFNWLLWVGTPLLVALGATGGYLGGRRGLRMPLAVPRIDQSIRPFPVPGSPEPERALLSEDIFRPMRTMVEIHFPGADSSEDPVLKAGEHSLMICALFDEAGLPVSNAPVDVTWPDSGSPMRLTTDGQGKCECSWTGDSMGDYQVRAEFPGDDGYLAASTVRNFRLFAPVPTQLETCFPGAASDTDPAWKAGEQVQLVCILSGETGLPVVGEPVNITWADSEVPIHLTTDRDGRCESSWTGDSRGEYQVKAEFSGNDSYLAASAVRGFRLYAPLPTHIDISFEELAEDLPPIWGVCEEIKLVFTLLDEEGTGVVGRPVEAVVGDNPPVQLVTGEQGSCHTVFTADIKGAYTAIADFQGDEDYLPSTAQTEFTVVGFREDVVERYNTFLRWVGERVPGVSGQVTPREMEVMVVSSGLYLDQRALEIVISRFEEADYSEHDIGRRQFEAMYRAWRQIVRT